MNSYEKAMNTMTELFASDRQFAFATAKDNVPTVRMIDTYYDSGAFYVVTYKKSRKVQEIEHNPNVSLCKDCYRFDGRAYEIGHPLLPQNKDIREKLMKAFEPWYFKHNNEQDEFMCYVKVELDKGFCYKDGAGYQIDFNLKEAETFPFQYEIVMTD